VDYWSVANTESAHRYIMYAEYAEKYRLRGDWKNYQHCIENAAFWFSVACFGRAESQKLL
jgi:hypothetical protein